MVHCDCTAIRMRASPDFQAEGQPMVQQRDTTKSRRSSGRTGGETPSSRGKPQPARDSAPARGDAALDAAARIAELERDLATARARITELESLREQALNRIDWAIDSLHNVLDGEEGAAD
jgi:hypothetical protein